MALKTLIYGSVSYMMRPRAFCLLERRRKRESMNDFDTVINSCSYLLNNSPEAEDCRSYLNERLKEETQQQFSFGYFPTNLSLLESFVSEDKLKHLSLMYTKEVGN